MAQTSTPKPLKSYPLLPKSRTMWFLLNYSKALEVKKTSTIASCSYLLN